MSNPVFQQNAKVVVCAFGKNWFFFYFSSLIFVKKVLKIRKQHLFFQKFNWRHNLQKVLKKYTEVFIKVFVKIYFFPRIYVFKKSYERFQEETLLFQHSNMWHNFWKGYKLKNGDWMVWAAGSLETHQWLHNRNLWLVIWNYELSFQFLIKLASDST